MRSHNCQFCGTIQDKGHQHCQSCGAPNPIYQSASSGMRERMIEYYRDSFMTCQNDLHHSVITDFATDTLYIPSINGLTPYTTS